MIRYRLTNGKLIDVDPALEQMFLASNPGAVIATEEVVELATEPTNDSYNIAGENISISQQEMDEIIAQANADPVKKIKEGEKQL